MKTLIIIITLGNNIERLENIYNLLKNVSNPWKLEIGINGNEINIKNIYGSVNVITYKEEEKIYDSNKRINGMIMEKGELGCAWTHHNLYYQLCFEEKEYDNYLIIEDDTMFINENESIKELNNILIFLDNNFNFEIIILNESLFYPFIKEKQINEYFTTIKKQLFNYASSYIISKNGARKLLSYTPNCINFPADDLLSNHFVFKDLNVIRSIKTIFKINKKIHSDIDNITLRDNFHKMKTNNEIDERVKNIFSQTSL